MPVWLVGLVWAAWATTAHGQETAAAAAKPATVAQLIVPLGALDAALSPDGRHVAVLEESPQGRRVRLVVLADQTNHVILRPRWQNDGYHIELRNPVRVMWVNSEVLAVDHGLAAEAIDLRGKPVTELASGLIGKARSGEPESTEVLVWNDDDHRSMAVIDVATKKSRRLSLPREGVLATAAFDEQGDVRAALMLDEGRWRDSSRWHLWFRPRGQQDWVQAQSGGVTEEAWHPLAASSTSDELLVATRRGRNTRALLRVQPLQPDRAPETLFADPASDVAASGALQGLEPVRVITLGLTLRQHWLDGEWREVQRVVDEALPGRVNRVSGRIDRLVLVHSHGDVEPGLWYLFEPAKGTLRLLTRARQVLDRAAARPMQALHYPARDGVPIPAYLTLPPGPRQPGPAVVLVHGGPHTRDHWGWDDEVQLLAQRGYAVLQPQFRGSTGFGLAFERAGYGQWGRLMQDDISDGVQHLVKQGIADPARVCIVGASYGGYAALWGLASTPELYRCGVSFAGVSDVAHLFDDGSDSLDNRAAVEWMRHTIGDIRRNREALDAVSPVTHAARIQAPLLIAHGDEDRRVPMSHARRMMRALDAARRPYEWLKLRDTGHGIEGLRARQEYFERLLQFLDRHIGRAGAESGSPPR